MQNRVTCQSRAAFLIIMLSLAPISALAGLGTAVLITSTAAEARPGFGGSMGSRGSRTFSAPPATNTNPGGASSFNRSMTPNPGQYGPGYAGNQAGIGGLRAHPFATGLAGGLLGAGIGSLLFGHHGAYAKGYGGGPSGFGNFFWLLIELAILFFAGRWLFRHFSGRRPGVSPGIGRAGNVGAAAPQVSNNDYLAFERALLDIQQAWSMQDLRSLSRFATPEMTSYFSEQLSDLASRNLRNAVSAVRMEKGDLSEAWSENGRDFVSVAMRYSMIDVTTDLTGRVVDGSPTERQTVTELWTFVRARGGSWLLSAIQQAR